MHIFIILTLPRKSAGIPRGVWEELLDSQGAGVPGMDSAVVIQPGPGKRADVPISYREVTPWAAGPIVYSENV